MLMDINFIEFVETKIQSEGSIQLQYAISEFYKVNKPLMDKTIAFLHGTGKYVVVRGATTQNLMIERNPNYETNQSVIKTNDSVQKTNAFIIQNSKRQNRLTIASIIVAGASALFAFGAMYTTLNDTTSEELKSLRLQLQKQSQVQEQMQQSQKGIDSSMKIFLERQDSSRH
jgi:hypothetical protein